VKGVSGPGSGLAVYPLAQPDGLLLWASLVWIAKVAAVEYLWVLIQKINEQDAGMDGAMEIKRIMSCGFAHLHFAGEIQSRYVLWLLVLPLLAVSCTDRIERHEVVGFYVANHSIGIDSLVIRDDGTYVHHYVSPDGHEFFDTNSWTLDSASGEITFRDFDQHFALWEKSPRVITPGPGFWITFVMRRGGHTCLRLFDDLNWYFEKRE
jgi:hypothetical protein